MKKYINIAICFLLLFAITWFSAPTKVCAASYNDLLYQINTDNTVTITGYSGSASAIDIPNSIAGCPVKSIGDSAFSGCRSLTSVAYREA